MPACSTVFIIYHSFTEIIYNGRHYKLETRYNYTFRFLTFVKLIYSISNNKVVIHMYFKNFPIPAK